MMCIQLARWSIKHCPSCASTRADPPGKLQGCTTNHILQPHTWFTAGRMRQKDRISLIFWQLKLLTPMLLTKPCTVSMASLAMCNVA